mgnify:FL=1
MMCHVDTIAEVIRILAESVGAVLRRHKVPEEEVEEILEEIGVRFSKKLKKEIKK